MNSHVQAEDGAPICLEGAPRGPYGLQGRVVGPCWEKLKPQGPTVVNNTGLNTRLACSVRETGAALPFQMCSVSIPNTLVT